MNPIACCLQDDTANAVFNFNRNDEGLKYSLAC